MNNEININDEVTVELTEYGQKVALQHYEKLNVGLLLVYRHVRADIYRFPLWELMNIFGKHTYMGANQVFVHNTILFAEDERTEADSIADAIKNMGWGEEDLKAAVEILKRK